MTCPEGWAATPNGNCGAVTENCPPNFLTQGGACRSVVALRLQNALYSLARTVRDNALGSLAVDGFVGPETVAAVNRAFTTHVGAGQAPGSMRTGKLTVTDVALRAEELAKIAEAEVLRRGGKLVTKVAVNVGPAAVKPAAIDTVDAELPGKLWALVGLELLAIGLGVYGTLKAPDADVAVTSGRGSRRGRGVDLSTEAAA